jgi:hypothetical protein
MKENLMIDHVFSVVCSGSAIDKETNSISIQNVLEQVTLFTNETGIITLPLSLEIFTLWILRDENIHCKGNMQVYFCTPNDECKNLAELEINLTEVLFYRTRIKSQVLQLKGPGRYKFLVKLKQDGSESWETVATLPLIVRFNQPPKD